VTSQGSTTTTVLQAINQALDEALAEDPRVFLLGEDIADPAGGVIGATRGLSTKYGADRVRDTPISEAAIAGAAIGAALDGLLPVAEIMIMDFLTIALDQLVNIAAKARFMSANRTTCPVTVRVPTFGGLGTGATHSQSLEAWLMHIPGLKVVMPSTPADAKGLLRSAIFDPDPCIFVETVATYGVAGEIPVGEHHVPIGKADIKRSGSDVTIIAYGRAVFDALEAADQLVAAGIDAEVVDLRTLLPLDLPTIYSSVGRTGRAVITHYAVGFSGPGAEIAARVGEELFSDLKAPVTRVASRFRPIPSAKHLEAEVYPNAGRIAAAARAAVEFVR
jgi:pyruvate dehydrogenase E1 component beta subunit